VTSAWVWVIFFSASACFFAAAVEGRGRPERTHREMLDVVGVDCERRLWLLVCAGRADTGSW